MTSITFFIVKGFILSFTQNSFDLHIGGGPGVVFIFTVSNSGKGGFKKLTSDSDSGASTTPGTIDKGQNFDYE